MGGGKKGNRDPLKQLEEREKKIHEKVNNPPSNEQQPMSKRFQKFVQMKNTYKSNKKETRQTIHDDFKNSDQMYRKKSKNETNRQHLKRVDMELRKRKIETEFAKKFQVEITRDEKTGEIRVKKDNKKSKKQKDLLQAAKLRLKQEKSKPAVKPQPTIDEEQSNYLVVHPVFHGLKKEKDEEEVIKRDFVAFGEVNKQPPNLSAIKSKKKLPSKKPGNRNLLLLEKFKNV